jgi:Zn-dependent M28 family amino/carboxypeptidase
MKRALRLAILIAVIGLGALTLSLPATARLDTTPAAFVYDPLVAALMTQVQSNTVSTYDAQLSGEAAAIIGGVPYTITTRNTNSGVPIQKATQFVYEYLQQQGLAVSYHSWSGCGLSNRNVVGVLTGTLQPSEIVLVTAHLDDMPSSGRAPGADDNASGSVGVMLAANIMSQYHFSRTVRFVLFTGEEQGLCGSAAYANTVSAAGDNIVAVYNMDMIAWDAVGGPTLRLHTRTTSNPGYGGDLAIAGVFTNVVATYGVNLTPIIAADGESASDHASFWNKGYPAILAIEDDVSDFNAYYHTSNDTLSRLNLTYFTNYVKASVGTAAHLAQPISDVAVLQGTIVDASNSNPIDQAEVFATAGVTRTGTATANHTGQYTLTLLEGNYQVTASAYGYLPQTVDDLLLQTNVTTTQNFSLTRAALYTVTGQVQDALTHQPLSATISIAGYPDSPIATDASGAYQIALAEAVAYTFHVQANVPGYLTLDRAVGPLTTNRVEDFALPADFDTCLAPGYTFIGLREGFNATVVPTNWTVINNVGTLGWSFNNPGGRGNLTGGTGNFAIADSDYAGSSANMNTELRTPVLDLTMQPQVTLTFKTDFYHYSTEVADVDVSINGAAGPWTNVWRKTGADYRGPKTESVNLTTLAGGQANVMLRFHYYNANYEWWWEVDDVQLGQCNPPTVINNPPILFPAAAMQSGYPGTVVTYTLNVSNTDSVSHTLDVSIADNAWPTTAATSIGPVAAQEVQPFTVTVAIPGDAAAHSSDAATITLRAQDNPSLSAEAILTTTANALPIVVLEPSSATQAANPGTLVTYTLYVSHTDVAAHTFDVSIANNTWPTTAATPIGPVAAQEVQPFTVTVAIPGNTAAHSSDAAYVVVRAQDDQAFSTTAILTTTANALPTVTLEPLVAVQSGNPSVIVTYTLYISHTDIAAHAFDVTLDHNSWPATVTTPISALPGNVARPITVTIAIPGNAIGQTADTTHVTVSAQDNALLTDTALLTTTAEIVPAVLLTPSAAAQSGGVGTTVTYALMLTNTGNLSDTYQLSLVNHVWLVQVDPLSMTLASQASQPLTVTVAIPLTATQGLSDTVRLTAHGTGVTAFSDLVTTAQRLYEIYLPLLRRD